jgi:hypothetical protein
MSEIQEQTGEEMAEEMSYSRRSGPRDRRLRVGTEEREAVAGILRREHVAGRLDNNEFDERLERCLSAKTYRELDGLLADLPIEELDLRSARWSLPPWPLLLFLPLIGVAIVASHGRAAWLLVPLFFWLGIGRFFWRGVAWRRWDYRAWPGQTGRR